MSRPLMGNSFRQYTHFILCKLISHVTLFRLKHQGVFELITKHKLYSAIHNSLEELMQLNTEQTLALLLWSGGGGVSVAPDIVVSRLSHNRFLLYQVGRILSMH